MTAVKQKITNKVQQTSKQKQQKAQPGGPTIAGVAGVGKQKTVTRPNSSRRPSIVHSHTTGPSTSGIGEGKESEFGANRQLTTSVRGKMAQKLERKPTGMNDYYAHNAKKTSVVKEDAPAMSVAGGAVPSITNPTVNYAFQVRKKMKGKLARRKQVK